MDPEAPLIVQSDLTILAEADSPGYPEARARLARFAELVKMPEHIHTYRITPLTLWNARASGLAVDEIIAMLTRFSRYPLPDSVTPQLEETASRYGALRLERTGEDGALRLVARHPALAEELSLQSSLRSLLGSRLDSRSFAVDAPWRGPLKRALVKLGWPVEDRAGFVGGAALEVAIRGRDGSGRALRLRDYQVEAADAFESGGASGAGVVSLPCGSGKTIIGMACLVRTGAHTLILVTSVTAARQWREELLDKTTLTEDDIGEYSGKRKELKPVTIATYQMLTHRSNKNKRRKKLDEDDDANDASGGPAAAAAQRKFTHFDIFDARSWGLIIYDEVHLLPAPLFQAAASVQARRRLGLTATLVREDGLEGDVFALIGPKLYELPWRELEKQGWIAPAVCTEIRLPLPESHWLEYATAPARVKPRVAAENPGKAALVRELLERHAGEPALVIGTYIDHLTSLAAELDLPVLDGSSNQQRRDELFGAFRRGEIPALAVSKIANFSIDLPDASVAIQISGQFGSRQEEAQRLGRLLRPKAEGKSAHFYTLVTRDTVEQEFALKRQLFLCEQGYAYRLHLLEDNDPVPPPITTPVSS